MLPAESLQRAGIELVPTLAPMPAALGVALDPEHPARDRTYLAPAIKRGNRFVTADGMFARLRERTGASEFVGRVVEMGAIERRFGWRRRVAPPRSADPRRQTGSRPRFRRGAGSD